MQMVKSGSGVASAMVLALLTALAVVPFNAMAAISLPTADVVGDIALIVAFVTAVGGAILGMIYIARGFKWAKNAG